MTPEAAAETVLGALRGRRSMSKIKPDAVPRTLVERVIETATWAPNHRRTAPWRFVVVAEDQRGALADLFRDALAREEPDAPAAKVAKAVDLARSAGALVVVVSAPIDLRMRSGRTGRWSMPRATSK